jgi:hypothetical protein
MSMSTLTPTAFGAIFHLRPVALPFLTPQERAAANCTEFGGECLFLMCHSHDINYKVDTVGWICVGGASSLDGLRQFDQVFAVMLQFTDGVFDVVHRQM